MFYCFDRCWRMGVMSLLSSQLIILSAHAYISSCTLILYIEMFLMHHSYHEFDLTAGCLTDSPSDLIVCMILQPAVSLILPSWHTPACKRMATGHSDHGDFTIVMRATCCRMEPQAQLSSVWPTAHGTASPTSVQVVRLLYTSLFIRHCVHVTHFV